MLNIPVLIETVVLLSILCDNAFSTVLPCLLSNIFMLRRYYSLVVFNNTLTSTSNASAISPNTSTEGCALLEHHLEMVVSFLPILSASQRLVLAFSAKTTLILLVTFLSDIFIYALLRWTFSAYLVKHLMLLDANIAFLFKPYPIILKILCHTGESQHLVQGASIYI